MLNGGIDFSNTQMYDSNVEQLTQAEGTQDISDIVQPDASDIAQQVKDAQTVTVVDPKQYAPGLGLRVAATVVLVALAALATGKKNSAYASPIDPLTKVQNSVPVLTELWPASYGSGEWGFAPKVGEPEWYAGTSQGFLLEMFSDSFTGTASI